MLVTYQTFSCMHSLNAFLHVCHSSHIPTFLSPLRYIPAFLSPLRNSLHSCDPQDIYPPREWWHMASSVLEGYSTLEHMLCTRIVPTRMLCYPCRPAILPFAALPSCKMKSGMPWQMASLPGQSGRSMQHIMQHISQRLASGWNLWCSPEPSGSTCISKR